MIRGLARCYRNVTEYHDKTLLPSQHRVFYTYPSVLCLPWSEQQPASQREKSVVYRAWYSRWHPRKFVIERNESEKERSLLVRANDDDDDEMETNRHTQQTNSMIHFRQTDPVTGERRKMRKQFPPPITREAYELHSVGKSNQIKNCLPPPLLVVLQVANLKLMLLYWGVACTQPWLHKRSSLFINHRSSSWTTTTRDGNFNIWKDGRVFASRVSNIINCSELKHDSSQ